MQQSELAYTYTYIPPFLDFLPVSVTTEHWVEFSELYSRFSLVIYFMHSINTLYMSVSISQFIPPLPHLVSICLFSTSASLFLLCTYVHLYRVFRFHIHAFVDNIYFCLADLLQSVYQCLGPTTSLQMTQCCEILWLNIIPLYVRTASSLSTLLFMGI